ncbi:MAG: AAA family ATPase [Proteobacteria bacterium]|nr:AAA family ATPase [Pseudomonadota bacterium]
MAVFDVAAVVIQLGDADKKRMLSPLTLTSMAMKNLKKRPPDREYILTLDGKPFMPGYVVGVLSATGGTGKTYFLMKMAYTMASGGSFGPIKATRKLKVVMICAEDDQDEVNRRLWDISGGVFPDTLYATSIYGEAGPLMRLDGNTPTRAETFYWLETFLRQNQGQIDVLIMDPKSRLYGLDENNNDHATEWIRCLEFLGKEYCVTILFATHTAKEAGKSISTATNRGAQAIIDGCRWGVVMAEIDQETAGKYGITNPRDYIVLDVQKSNYAARQSHYLYFKRGLNGVLEYVPLADIKNGGMVETFVYFLGAYDWTPTPRDLEKHGNVSKIVKDMESNFPGFKKGDLPELAEYCVEKGALEKMEVMGGNYVKTFNYRVPKNNA